MTAFSNDGSAKGADQVARHIPHSPTFRRTLPECPPAAGLWSRMVRILVLIALFGLLASVTPLHADTAAPQTSLGTALPDPLTSEAITAMVSRLSDAEVRQLLLDKLGAETTAAKAATPEPVPTLGEVIASSAVATSAYIVAALRSAPDVLIQNRDAMIDYAQKLGSSGALAFMAGLSAAGLAGFGAKRLVRRLLEREPLRGRVVKTLARELLELCAAFLAMLAVIRITMDGSEAEIAQAIAFWLVLVPQAGSRVLQTVLQPTRPSLRLVAVADKDAAYLWRNLLGVLILVCAAFTLKRFNVAVLDPGEVLSGPNLHNTAFWVSLAIFGWLAIIALRGREGLSSIIRGRGDALTRFERSLAAAYPWFAVGAILFTWVASVVMAATGVEQAHKGLHLLSLLILLVVPLLDTAIRFAVHRLALPMQGEGEVAEAAYTASLQSYKRIARVALLGLVIAISTNLWDVSLLDAASAGLGAQVAAHVIRATLICLVGYLIWEIIRLVINRKLAREPTEARVAIAQDDIEGQRNEPISSRLATVLPPISWTLQGTVITMTVLTALGNIGIDITPLLAGAGVAGIAIGFGAQKLVSDIVSGIFFLFDDAFRLNEYIDAGGTLGTVEKISLRSIRLRDDNGPLYCIPYSEVSRVTNFGRDWGIMKLKFTVPFDTDPEKVRRIFKRIGQEMLQNPELADSFIEPFKSQGVNAFNETGMVVRGKFKFKPGTQFAIRKEIYHRVQQEFAASGIEFARKEVRVKISGGEGLTSQQTSAVAAGAVEGATEPRQAG
jgi:small-conductance mechanosensitive channel